MERTRTHAITAPVLKWAGDHGDRHARITACLQRHYRRDWGDVDRYDWAANDRSVACQAGRLLSAYQAPVGLDTPDDRLWIITDDLDDPDTVTTILWPSDY